MWDPRMAAARAALWAGWKVDSSVSSTAERRDSWWVWRSAEETAKWWGDWWAVCWAGLWAGLWVERWVDKRAVLRVGGRDVWTAGRTVCYLAGKWAEQRANKLVD